MPRPWVIVAAVLVIGLRSVDGQDAGPGAQRTPFRAGIDVIGMNVTATDASRRYVTDLDQQDFQIFEDGRPQQVMFFRKSSLPLALALLIDTSASMQQNLGVAQEAAVGFVRALGPEDIASVIDFDTRVEVRQDFTTDRSALEHAIRKTAAGGSTALYNAVYIALKGLNKTIGDERLEDRRRRAIVILSDGEDTSSLLGFDEVLDLAVRSDTAIYAIGLLGPEISATLVKQPSDSRFVLRRLSEQTGGRVFFASDAKELSGVYGKIRAELASQYFLAYESNDPRRNGQYRRISVRVNRASVVARARPGYYAPSQ
jgi:Ca-activated chloride channel family protein